jgi:dihydrofolate synthase/folylpolyglutamate synthase
VRGFENLEIPGRMELVSRNPAVLFDIAHNAEKAESLVASLRERFADRRVHYVVAIGESKDARTILQILGRLPSTFTFTSFSVPGRRAIAPARLAAIADCLGTWGRVIADPVEALTVARRHAQFDDVVVVTGSTFVVAALRALYAPIPA